MKDNPAPEDHSSGEVESISLPDSVMRMWDLMLAVNPKWDFREWLHERAIDELELLAVDLKKEKLRAKQRIYRLENLGRRLNPPEKKDEGQTSLFDMFEFENKEEDIVKEEEEISEPSYLRHLSDFFGSKNTEEHPGDDPLLAVTSQLILMRLEAEKSKGRGEVSSKQIIKELGKRGISEEEVEEGIDFLLTKEKIVETDNDVFMAY
ncbi:MAG TPA: hypothetical protein QF644_02535 [Candidatus Poseidoniaceae archaeon]|nr:hypothetical protein [Candidatus Poseidoniaceae archaeon]